MPQGVAFDVERFEWTDDHRLEVSGRWYGLRGHRFVRPALTVEADDGGDDRRRMLADLEHKPWAADEGTDWIAAFPWDGEPVELARAELAVAPTLAIDLPLPRPPGRRRKRTPPTRAASRKPAKPTPASSDTRSPEREEAIAQRDQPPAERDTPPSPPDSLRPERDEAIAQRDKAIAQRDEAVAQRDQAVAQRDALIRERDAAVRARAAAIEERDELRRSLATAVSERDAAVAARDRAAQTSAGLLRERDAARAARQRDLEALDGADDRGAPPPPPAAPSVRRPAAALRRQSAIALWGQRFAAVIALGVLAFVVYTLLEGVV